MDKGVDVAIIGGGAIGCSTAYHAASRGARVVLFEAEEIGSGSSAALAGMLSGQGEAEKPGPLRDLLIQGREYHKTFAQELYETTELDPGYVWDGALRTATDGASKERLLKEHSWHEKANLPSEWLSGDEARGGTGGVGGGGVALTRRVGRGELWTTRSAYRDNQSRPARYSGIGRQAYVSLRVLS